MAQSERTDSHFGGSGSYHGFGYLSLVSDPFDLTTDPFDLTTWRRESLLFCTFHCRVVDTKTTIFQMGPNILNEG